MIVRSNNRIGNFLEISICPYNINREDSDMDFGRSRLIIIADSISLLSIETTN